MSKNEKEGGDNMKLFKSKTIDFNILVPALWAFLTAVGVDIPEDVMIGILAIGNFILRFFTAKPLSEK